LEITKSNPSLAEQGLNLIRSLIVNDNISVRESAYKVLKSIVESDLPLAKHGLEIIKINLQVSIKTVREGTYQFLKDLLFNSSIQKSNRNFQII
jgi:hypothetical protein